jgi:hypothetical protein
MTEQHEGGNVWKERRAFWRNTVVWNGNLNIEDGSVECVVLNVSANGAKLHFSKPIDFSDPKGVLCIPRLGEFAAEIAWVKGTTVGLRFEESPERVQELIADALPQSRHVS